jgi:flavin-dependent dehydrogenase
MADLFDVVIVGGGVGGSALARSLTQAGVAVLVLEKTSSVPMGAARRCGGKWA